MLELVLESVRGGPWLLDMDFYPKEAFPDFFEPQASADRVAWLATDFHQLNCVHQGGTVNNQLKDLIAKPHEVGKDSGDHQHIRYQVSACCGLAGVIPHWKTGILQAGRAVFDKNNTKVSIYMSNESVKRPRDMPVLEEGPQSSAFMSQTETEHLFQLTDEQTGQIKLLEHATTRFCEAAALLQDSKRCCNEFTVIVSRNTSDLQSREVALISITFETLQEFCRSVWALRTRNVDTSSAIRIKDLRTCSTIGERILSIFAYPQEINETLPAPVQRQFSLDYDLHISSLATQLLGLGLVLYTQGHLGPLSSYFLKQSLTEINLLGTGDDSLYIKASLRELTCLGEMVGGSVFVFQVVYPSTTSMASQTLPYAAVDIRCRGVDLIDTWGPGLFISEVGAPYCFRLYAIEIGGGSIKAIGSGGTNHSPPKTLFHWSSRFHSYNEMRTLPTFSSWDEILIGAVSIQNACPLDPERCRKNSQAFLCNLGTRSDYWELAERQFAFQAGYYTVLQVGNIYARKLGRTVKQQIVEQWSLSPNLRHLVVPWGLQISLCTGIANRVSLRKLIEDSMFAHVDTLGDAQWHRMLPKARAAFRGSIDLKSWVEGLNSDEKICLIAIIASALNLLKDTGVDRKCEYMSILWPDASSASYGVKIRCNEKNAWIRILQDSESCATFAAVTSTCLEGHKHVCRNVEAPSWQDCQGLLSTAVCRGLTTGGATANTSAQLQLEDGQRYWVGKIAGDYWVVARKPKDGDVQLVVKCNRFPKMLAQTFWKPNVIRERPDVNFDAEDVLILGGESWH